MRFDYFYHIGVYMNSTQGVIQLFRDRKEAGRSLANRLSKYKKAENILILALPRGGVPVAFEVAKSLKVPLNAFITRKLRFPDSPELAVGALAENGEIFLNDELIIPYTPSPFIAVGVHYSDFRQVSDEEVKEYIEKIKTIFEAQKKFDLLATNGKIL